LIIQGLDVMQVLLSILTLLAGLSIAVLPLSTGFFPRLGLTPLKLGQRRSIRLAQIMVLWALAISSLWIRSSVWGWFSVGIALFFTAVAARLYPRNIFVALDQPNRAQAGLANTAPVLAVEIQGDAVAYPLALIVPHHIINDRIGGKPVLVAW
jgi:hypothetical protein